MKKLPNKDFSSASRLFSVTEYGFCIKKLWNSPSTDFGHLFNSSRILKARVSSQEVSRLDLNLDYLELLKLLCTLEYINYKAVRNHLQVSPPPAMVSNPTTAVRPSAQQVAPGNRAKPPSMQKAKPQVNVIVHLGDTDPKEHAPLGAHPVGRPLPRHNPGNSAIPRPLTRQQIEEQENHRWLDSEKNWRNRVGKGWVAKRVLGKGGYGIVGHWTYKGPDRDQKKIADGE